MEAATQPHPDPTGPDEPEEPRAARDGDAPERGRSVAAQAEDAEPLEAEEQPLPGGRLFSVAHLGVPKKTPVEHRLSLNSASVPARGLWGVDDESVLVVRVLPGKTTESPIREDGKTRLLKVTQALEPLSIRTPKMARDDLMQALEGAYEGETEVLEAIEHLRDKMAVVAEREGVDPL